MTNSLLITGGCGFIGVNLIDFLFRQGITKVRILDNLSVGTVDALEAVLREYGEMSTEEQPGRIHYTIHSVGPGGSEYSVELQIGDIRNLPDCEGTTKDISAVVHLAAQSGVPVSVENPLVDCEMNVIGTLNMLEACRKNNVDKFIFASSGAPLGDVEPPIHEQKVPKPISPYGAGKLAGEAYCSAYYRTFGLKTVTLRFGNVYGPRSQHKTSVVAKFFKRALDGLPLEIYGDGSQTRDFIYVEDLCKAIYLSLKALGLSTGRQALSPRSSSSAGADVAGEVFQIATFKESTVSEIASRIRMIVEREHGKNVTITHTEKRLGDIQRNYSDISKAMNLLGFAPAYDLDKGLYKTWKAFSRIQPLA